jgi:hypothetical protein
MAGAQLHLRGQCPWPGRLYLDQFGPGSGGVHGLLQRVQVAAQQIERPAVVTAGSGSDPVPGRHQLHGEIDEQRRGAANHVGSGASRRQLRRMRQLGQLADHNTGRFAGVGARHRTNPRSSPRCPGS